MKQGDRVYYGGTAYTVEQIVGNLVTIKHLLLPKIVRRVPVRQLGGGRS